MPAASANLFIIGFPRCGTSSVYTHLAAHPAIYGPPVKEPHFYGRVIDAALRESQASAQRARQRYEATYDGQEARTARYRLDGSATYCWHDDAPARILQACPEASILVMLRDPIERAASHHGVALREGAVSEGLLDAIQVDLEREEAGIHARERFVGAGRYATHLARWQEVFGADRIHVALLEDLRANPRQALAGMARFLNVDAAPILARNLTVRHNAADEPRSDLARAVLGLPGAGVIARAMPRPVRRLLRRAALKPVGAAAVDVGTASLLRDVYRDEVARLPALTGLTLDHLRASWPTYFAAD